MKFISYVIIGLVAILPQTAIAKDKVKDLKEYYRNVKLDTSSQNLKFPEQEIENIEKGKMLYFSLSHFPERRGTRTCRATVEFDGLDKWYTNEITSNQSCWFELPKHIKMCQYKNSSFTVAVNFDPNAPGSARQDGGFYYNGRQWVIGFGSTPKTGRQNLTLYCYS